MPLQRDTPPPAESAKPSAKYDTPAINALLLRIFGEECRDVIHATLGDLDAENAPSTSAEVAEDVAGAGASSVAAPVKASPAEISPADPFKAIGDELRHEDRLGYVEAFKRRETGSS